MPLASRCCLQGQVCSPGEYYEGAPAQSSGKPAVSNVPAMPADLRSELLADSRLPPGLLFLPEGGRPVKEGPPRQVLLTGATGFVGGFVLRELLERVDKVGLPAHWQQGGSPAKFVERCCRCRPGHRGASRQDRTQAGLVPVSSSPLFHKVTRVGCLALGLPMLPAAGLLHRTWQDRRAGTGPHRQQPAAPGALQPGGVGAGPQAQGSGPAGRPGPAASGPNPRGLSPPGRGEGLEPKPSRCPAPTGYAGLPRCAGGFVAWGCSAVQLAVPASLLLLCDWVSPAESAAPALDRPPPEHWVQEVDCIIHNGAHVNSAYSYQVGLESTGRGSNGPC